MKIFEELDYFLLQIKLFYHFNILHHELTLKIHCKETYCTFFICWCYNCKKSIGWLRRDY